MYITHLDKIIANKSYQSISINYSKGNRLLHHRLHAFIRLLF